MKLTKRKGFNFFRSYFDVYNELEDSDKVAFIDALLDRQFLGTKPKNLTGMAKFAYISQTNSIDSQVVGYEDKTKTRLDCTPYVPPTEGGTQPPRHGGNEPPTVQEKEKEKGQYVYSEEVFLENWSKCREYYLKQPTGIKSLNFTERNALKEALKNYSKEEINEAMITLFQQEKVLNESMRLRPQHFLDKIDVYYSGNGNTKIWGK